MAAMSQTTLKKKKQIKRSLSERFENKWLSDVRCHITICDRSPCGTQVYILFHFFTRSLSPPLSPAALIGCIHITLEYVLLYGSITESIPFDCVIDASDHLLFEYVRLTRTHPQTSYINTYKYTFIYARSYTYTL